jgi:uncharacterized protein (DUF1697 family)
MEFVGASLRPAPTAYNGGMQKYIAFLRAINVGGHTVKMDLLREIFESLGFSNVETFIASGNIIFETKDISTKDISTLEKTIEKKLNEELGFEVATFIRSNSELGEIAKYKPFKQSQIDSATALNVAFLSQPLDDKSKKLLMSLKSDIDSFHVHGRDIYWLCLKKQSDSKFSNAVLQKTLDIKSTLRGMNTIKKIAEKYIV